jgi:hypothetical protein
LARESETTCVYLRQFEKAFSTLRNAWEIPK